MKAAGTLLFRHIDSSLTIYRAKTFICHYGGHFGVNGGGGIRTHGRLAPTTVFKTVTIGHSDTPPRYIELSYHDISGFSENFRYTHHQDTVLFLFRFGQLIPAN